MTATRGAGLRGRLGEPPARRPAPSVDEIRRALRTRLLPENAAADLGITVAELLRLCRLNGLEPPPRPAPAPAPAPAAPPPPAPPAHACPECGEVFGAAKALGSHRWYKHRISGTSGSTVRGRRLRTGVAPACEALKRTADQLRARAAALEADLEAVRAELASVPRAVAVLEAPAVVHVDGERP